MEFDSAPKAETALSPEALFTLVQKMKSDFDRERANLEEKITHLESELNSVRQQTQVAKLNVNTTAPEVTSEIDAKSTNNTTRRNLLKKLAAGAAGVAALSLANVPASQAQVTTVNSLQFPGYPGVPQSGQNSAYSTTYIVPNTSANSNQIVYSQPVPLLTVDNSSSLQPNGSNPDTSPIGIYAKSTNSYALYGYTTGNAAGVLGLSKSTTLPTGSFYSSQVAGVVGASTQDKGVVGMSPNREGVLGLSTTSSGVSGVSQTGIGGAFGVEAATNTGAVGGGFAYDQGAALRLGLRNTFFSPNKTSFSHNAGEIVMDKIARVHLCTTTYVKPGLNEPTAVSDAFYSGPVSANGSSWRLLPHLTVRTQAPQLNGQFQLIDPSDVELHSTGELWLDTSSGRLYSCTASGSNDPNVLASVGLPTTQKATFRPVASGLQFLPYPDRWLDTFVGTGYSTPGVAPVDRQAYDVQVTGVGGERGGQETLIPVGAQAVFGTALLLGGSAPSGSGLVKIVTGGFTDYLTKGTSSLVFRNGGDAFAPVFVKLDAQGRMRFAFVNGSVLGNVLSKLVIDIVAYVP